MLDLARGAAACDVIEGGSVEVLRDLHRPGCAAAIWQRRLPPLFSQWLDALPDGCLPRLRSGVPLHGVANLVQDTCRAAFSGADAGQALLAQDVARLAAEFSRIAGKDALQIRLDVVRGNACSKFHVDYVPARLLCTYRGAGTQYGLASETGEPAQVQQMQAGWVGLFRGRLWPGDLPCGLLHRSPPIAGSGETRLLLVIDAAQDSDD
ncbi:hypothetical protein AYJ57_17460 [Salipiger sp. CCB-MM3]|uniref:DUF1826 domain-containing protein n=1 Tax=Salipiger sp. CCB-MM3 TaxID=1792508 RepID=UPI00080AB9E4|nr:DUF1826 domain-containing protein [Salipiger sp. CCB-MM3]ANT62213.1 hypothetical protein AYJ57_17460 [Salipiger sp. CCB-MM3]